MLCLKYAKYQNKDKDKAVCRASSFKNIHICKILCSVSTLFSRFDESVDSGGGFKHKSVLAMPIKYSASPGRVMGVFQLVNKVRTVST